MICSVLRDAENVFRFVCLAAYLSVLSRCGVQSKGQTLFCLLSKAVTIFRGVLFFSISDFRVDGRWTRAGFIVARGGLAC